VKRRQHDSDRASNDRDEEFVELVSDALFVPDAAPEIRMIAEVMASMSIPSSRYNVVTDLGAHTRRFGTKAIAAGVAALAIVGLAASAYAGVLPASIQDVAHHVIDAPSGRHSHGNVHAPGTAGTSGDASGAPGAPPATTHASPGANSNATHGNASSGAGHSAPPRPTPTDTSSHGRKDNGHHNGGPSSNVPATPTPTGSPAATP